MGTTVLQMAPSQIIVRGFGNASQGQAQCSGKCACGKCSSGKRLFGKRRAAKARKEGFNNLVAFTSTPIIYQPSAYYAPLLANYSNYNNCCGG